MARHYRDLSLVRLALTSNTPTSSCPTHPIPIAPAACRPNKLKILIGFYQIATRVETVYDILLPAQVRELLLTIQFTISIGIDGVPLACVGANGYIPRLVFWTVLPLVVVAIGSCLGAARIILATRTCATHKALLEGIMPSILRIFFLSYPIVTNVAFEGECSTSSSPTAL